MQRRGHNFIMRTSVNPEEIAHFARDSANWWDETGPFRPLHRMAPLRLRYIRDRVMAHGIGNNSEFKALEGLSVLDIGCGGGLVCEPLARLGARVTGIDADETAIRTAREHADRAGLAITYQVMSAEELLTSRPKTGRKSGFDVVLALEIVEHVDGPADFIASCVALCRPGGLLILSTLNRTPQSFLVGIVGAEHILRWVPRGTHDWRKFVRPSELAGFLRRAGAAPDDVTGYRLNLASGAFEFCDTKDVNYFMTAVKHDE